MPVKWLKTMSRKTSQQQKPVEKREFAGDTVAMLVIISLLHVVLFAYQKKLKDILGTGEAIFAHPVIETILTINEERRLNLVDGDTLDQVFANFSQKIMNSKVAKTVRFEKLGPKNFVLHLDECMFAEHVHHLLKPEDVTCPFALLAMSILESVVGHRAKNSRSEFTELGSRTKIRC